MTEIDLLKCPFCGSNAYLEEDKTEIHLCMKNWVVFCMEPDCVASRTVYSNGRTPAEAAENWNQRAQDFYRG